MIVVIGDNDDPRVQYSLHHLVQRGYDHCLFNTQAYPTEARLTQTMEAASESGYLMAGKGQPKVPISEIQSVYYCVQNGFQVSDDELPEIRSIVYNNIESAAWSFFHSLDCLFVNPIEPANFHSYKAAVSQRMRRGGFGCRTPW